MKESPEKKEKKAYFSLFVDRLEADLYLNTNERFNKRSSVTSKGGRPYLYSPREIGEKMVSYFRRCIKNNQPFTITGLCLEIGISRSGLFYLEKCSNNEFINTIKKGKSMVEHYLEIQLHVGHNPREIIFVLRSMGWNFNNPSKTKSYCGFSDKQRSEARERMKHLSE